LNTVNLQVATLTRLPRYSFCPTNYDYRLSQLQQ
jgi:hypothetical protein